VPPSKKAPSSRAKQDPRAIVTSVPTEGTLAGYILAAHQDGAGVPLNKFDVVEVPMPGDFPKGLSDPALVTVKAEVSYGDALRYIAGRIDADLKEYPIDAPPATVTPIRKKVAPVKKAAAKKTAPRAGKVPAKKVAAVVKKAPVRKSVAGPAKTAAKKTPSRRRSTS
jgi:hypothetical protein